MSYLDSNPSQRAELRDAGRLGYGRFEGPEPAFCSRCGYRTDLHAEPTPTVPQHCPTEREALARWGR
jgi:hypothetical protein